MQKQQTTQSSNTIIAGQRSEIIRRKSGKAYNFLSSLPFVRSFSNKPVVAVLRLEGVIGKVNAAKSGLTLHVLNKLIEQILSMDKLDALCLTINSPGGSPTQSELIANRIITLAKEKKVPVYSFIEDVAASGGYWLACAGEQIFANKSSIIGSIGVISSSFGFYEAIQKLGIERRIYTEGKAKSILDPFKPIKSSDIKIIKKVQKEIHEHFISSIRNRRSGRLTQSDAILFNGEFWAGQTAVDFGLVDQINDVYSFIQENFGRNVNIKHIEYKQSFFKRYLGLCTLSTDILSNVMYDLFDKLEAKIQHSKFNFK